MKRKTSAKPGVKSSSRRSSGQVSRLRKQPAGPSKSRQDVARKTKAALSPKQLRFVTEYMKDQNGTQAAIRAGYSERTAKQQGSRLLTNADINSAVNKGLQRVAKRTDITIESLAAEYEEARKLAKKHGQASAMVAATTGKGKLSGLLVERHKHSGAIGTYDLTRVSDEDLDRLEAILGPLADDGGDQGGEVEA